MTKDEAREKAIQIAGSVHKYNTGPVLIRAIVTPAFDAGYAARDAVTCVWTVTDAHAYGIVYRASCKPDTDLQDVEFDDGEEPATVFPKFCPNCGGKIVPPDSGEEKNDDE